MNYQDIQTAVVNKNSHYHMIDLIQLFRDNEGVHIPKRLAYDDEDGFYHFHTCFTIQDRYVRLYTDDFMTHFDSDTLEVKSVRTPYYKIRDMYRLPIYHRVRSNRAFVCDLVVVNDKFHIYPYHNDITIDQEVIRNYVI